jgi:hypothetical protein
LVTNPPQRLVVLVTGLHPLSQRPWKSEKLLMFQTLIWLTLVTKVKSRRTKDPMEVTDQGWATTKMMTSLSSFGWWRKNYLLVGMGGSTSPSVMNSGQPVRATQFTM